ncbi:substrate-binding domain-containing protein [Pseudomonas matsuisoli]|uniref:Membrane protein n=1 Tax=Pseudomonas matsuisoli TaxID=1515666 RepID=A0A917UUH4_9PSED|nr:phosphate ABC transporter substrate-binding/OmpA family protein [Pseudomonas matsuisoli]GGJ86012.1 membrane protein [Pseudomonas matsuisoli]
MSQPTATYASEIWCKTLCYVLVGFFFYAIPWSVFAALPVPADGQAALRIQGSNTIGAELAPALVKGLLEQEGYRAVKVSPGDQANEQVITAQAPTGKPVTVTLAAHGSSTGFKALAVGQADVAASSRPIKGEEAQTLSALGDLRSKQGEQIIALDGLAIVVNPKNPIKALNVAQLAGIFSGEISDWSQVGGDPGAITLYARDDNSGTYDTFKELVLSSNNKRLGAAAKRYESSEELSDSVAADRNGIGFIGLPYVRQARALGISDGAAAIMPPTIDTIATEDYPLSRRLFLYASPTTPNMWTHALAEFAQSPAGQAIVAKNGFVGQQPKALKVSGTSGMPAEYRELASRGERLSVNFRFAEGSATLDNKAQRDIERVVRYMESEGTGKEVALIGFSDDKADDSRARLLSRLRAMAVRRELFKAGVLPQEINGLGNALPVAANDDDAGRIRNRRVEVWVY